MRVLRIAMVSLVLILTGCDYSAESAFRIECSADENIDNENNVSSFKYEGQRAFASLLLNNKPIAFEQKQNKPARRTFPQFENNIPVLNTRKLPLEIKKLPDVYDQLSKNYRTSYLVIDHNSGDVHLGIAGIGIGKFESGVYKHDPMRYNELDKM